MRFFLLAAVGRMLWLVCANTELCNDDSSDDVVALLQQPLAPRLASMRSIRADDSLNRDADPDNFAADSLGDSATENNSESVSTWLDQGEQPDTSLASSFASLLEANPVKPSTSKIITRPSVRKGQADQVWFGLKVHKFFGMHMRDEAFTVDLVSTLKWKDMRAVKLIPAGLSNITLSEKQAESSIWMPEVDVTNRDIRSAEVISTGVTIFKSGWVHRVQRQVVRVKHEFALLSYPFDKQKLLINVASTKYMENEVTLSPSPTLADSGVSSKLFDQSVYDLDGWHETTFDEANGALVKSRGQLSITVKRGPLVYIYSHMVPTAFLLLLCYFAFWIPLGQFFVTPRLACAVLALLAFVGLMFQSEAALPEGSPMTWNTILNGDVLLVMVIICILNVYIEVVFHSYKLEALAAHINLEATVRTLIMAITITFWITLAAATDLCSHFIADTVAKCLMGVIIIPFIVNMHGRVKKAYAEVQMAAAAKGGPSLDVFPQPRASSMPQAFGFPPGSPAVAR